MKSKSLIITFVCISIVALIVSAFAVFTVARAYSHGLQGGTETTLPVSEYSDTPDSTAAVPTGGGDPETETAEADETSKAAESSEQDDTAQPAPQNFVLILKDGRLVVSRGEDKLYERIINENDLHEKDRDLLQKGIEFSDFEKAMSAVYDIIS
ncbi:MAG: hypothetical protein ACI3XI_08080 [Eubacteriales bacterium]